MVQSNETQQPNGITRITVGGFKSLRRKSHIEVRPLTILAGANSSGKSSILQPLLLMKQTLEASYDPGPLLLNGPNVKFTSTKQFLSRTGKSSSKGFFIQIDLTDARAIKIKFEKHKETGRLDLDSVDYINSEDHTTFSGDYPVSQLNKSFKKDNPNSDIHLVREHFFWDLELKRSDDKLPRNIPGTWRFFLHGDAISAFETIILQVMHIPGLRGSPERAYGHTPSPGPIFQGTFEKYAASILNHWREKSDFRFTELAKNLYKLGLTASVSSELANEVIVEISVGRTLKNDLPDLVSIADVGFGVAQVLPILVALLVAKPGQLVYIEQPELHLHPRAQVALAQMLADAANRGVRVVAETHSSLLIQGIQTLVAKENLSPEKVILHWFTRDDKGITQITPRELDKYGGYGDWPEDFAEVQFDTDSAYLDSVEKRRFEEFHDGQESEMSGD